jgi:hypothetical protein
MMSFGNAVINLVEKIKIKDRVIKFPIDSKTIKEEKLSGKKY